MRKMQTRFVADISKYTENFFLGMSPRQTIFGILGGAVILLGSYLLPVPQFIPMLVGFAIIMFGFFQPEGLPLEKYIKAWWDSHFTNPITRHYEADNIVYDFLWRGEIGGRTCFRPADYLDDEEPDNRADTAQTDGEGRQVRQLSATTAEAVEEAAGQPDTPWALTPDEAEGKTPKQIRKLENDKRREYNRQMKEQRREKRRAAKAARTSARPEKAKRRKLSAEAPAPAVLAEENSGTPDKETQDVDYRKIGYNREPEDWTDAGGGKGTGYSAVYAASEEADVPAEVPQSEPAAEETVPGVMQETGRGNPVQAVLTETDKAEPAGTAASDAAGQDETAVHDEPAEPDKPVIQDEPSLQSVPVTESAGIVQTGEPVAAEQVTAGQTAGGAEAAYADTAEPETETAPEPEIEPEPEQNRDPEPVSRAEDTRRQLAADARNRYLQERMLTAAQQRRVIPLQGARSRQPGDYSLRRAGR